MLMALAALLALLSGFAALAAPVLYLRRQRALACRANGLALSVVAAGALLAMAVNPDPGINATGLAALGGVIAVAVLSFYSAAQESRQRWGFALGLVANACVALALGYLVTGFKIF